jgi:fumarate hydratase class II
MLAIVTFGIALAAVGAVAVGAGVNAAPELGLRRRLTALGLQAMTAVAAAVEALAALADLTLVAGAVVVADATPVFGATEIDIRTGPRIPRSIDKPRVFVRDLTFTATGD